MNQFKTSSDLKNQARILLSGKYGASMLVSPVIPAAICVAAMMPLVFIILVPLVVQLILSGAEISINALTVPLIILMVLTVVVEILLGVFNTGAALFFLNIACGRRHSVSDLFYGFRRQFKKSLALSAIFILWSNVCLLPYQICSVKLEFDSQLKWGVGALIFYIIGMLIYTPLSLMISQSYYLLLDFPQYSVKELLKFSVHVMKGHKGRLFYIQLSFLPLTILSVFSCYIGFLWLMPYQQMTYALFFLDLMQPKTSASPD